MNRVNVLGLHAKSKRNRNACRKTQENHVICDDIDLQLMILSHFASAAQRWGLAPSLRTSAAGHGCRQLTTVANARATLGERRLQPPDLQIYRGEPFATHSGKLVSLKSYNSKEIFSKQRALTCFMWLKYFNVFFHISFFCNCFYIPLKSPFWCHWW